MTEKIARRGIKTPDSYEPDNLEKINVGDAIKNNGLIIGEQNTINEVREWLTAKHGTHSNYFIIADNDGGYKGILSSSNLFSNHHNGDSSIASLIKRKKIFITNDNNLRDAVEVMARENIDVLPGISGENNVIGILSYKDIIATDKHSADEHEKKRPHISLKRQGLKILISGKKIVSAIKQKEK